MRSRRSGRGRRPLFRYRQHRSECVTRSSAPCSRARRVSRLWRSRRDFGRSRNPEAPARSDAEAHNPHHRLVSHCHEIQPMQQIADHIARSRAGETQTLRSTARRIRAVKWRLWHGRVDRAIRDLQELLDGLTPVDEITDLSTSRLRSLGAQLLTYIDSNRSAIINYGKRYRAGLRVASTLAESAVNSVGSSASAWPRLSKCAGLTEARTC
jgi:hypothetical protein